MDLKLLKMLCKDSKQHHVMFHELYSVSSLLCIAQNVRFEIPYKVLYFETPFLIIFKYYAWVSCALARAAILNEEKALGTRLVVSLDKKLPPPPPPTLSLSTQVYKWDQRHTAGGNPAMD